jgi:hypothetical protein
MAWLPLAGRPCGTKHMVKLKLDMDPDPEVTIIGISSHVKDYRLCWSLNRSMGLSFARRREDIVDGSPARPAHFPVFDHMDPDHDARLTLVSNHGADGILLKEHKQADYFLVADNELADTMPDLLDRVRRAEFVLTAFTLDFEHLREGHKLLQEPQ